MVSRGRRPNTAALLLLVVVAVAACCAAGVYLRARHAPAAGQPPAAPGGNDVPWGLPQGPGQGKGQRDEPEGRQGEGREGEALPGASVVLEGTKIVVPGPSGDPEWEFSAEKIEIAQERKIVRLTGVEGARYVGGATQARVRAGALTADLGSGRLEFEGGIEVTGEGGAAFSADSARWDPAAPVFMASGDVRYSDGMSITITGDVLEADGRLESVLVKGGVRFRTVVSGG